MPRISEDKKKRISEQILHYLFNIAPQPKFTVDIAREVARDEEFVKNLLEELKKKNLVLEIKKNSSGSTYLRRQRWRISDPAFNIYTQKQSRPNPLNFRKDEF